MPLEGDDGDGGSAMRRLLRPSKVNCDHEEQRTARLLRIETLRRYDADAIGGHYEVVWCEKCGAIKEGDDEWQLPERLK